MASKNVLTLHSFWSYFFLVKLVFDPAEKEAVITKLTKWRIAVNKLELLVALTCETYQQKRSEKIVYLFISAGQLLAAFLLMLARSNRSEFDFTSFEAKFHVYCRCDFRTSFVFRLGQHRNTCKMPQE